MPLIGETLSLKRKVIEKEALLMGLHARRVSNESEQEYKSLCIPGDEELNKLLVAIDCVMVRRFGQGWLEKAEEVKREANEEIAEDALDAACGDCDRISDEALTEVICDAVNEERAKWEDSFDDRLEEAKAEWEIEARNKQEALEEEEHEALICAKVGNMRPEPACSHCISENIEPQGVAEFAILISGELGGHTLVCEDCLLELTKKAVGPAKVITL